jgi:hypothetical protein
MLYFGSIYSLIILVKYFTNITNRLKNIDFFIVGLSALNFALKYNENLFIVFGLFFEIYIIFLFFNYKGINIVEYYKEFINKNPNYILYNYCFSLILNIGAFIFYIFCII